MVYGRICTPDGWSLSTTTHARSILTSEFSITEAPQRYTCSPVRVVREARRRPDINLVEQQERVEVAKATASDAPANQGSHPLGLLPGKDHLVL